MKRTQYLILALALISLLAATGFAQTEGENQSQNQAQTQSQTQTQAQTQTQTQAQTQTQTQAQTQSQAQTQAQTQTRAQSGECTGGEGDPVKVLDPQEPSGDMIRAHNYNDAAGIDANGGIHRNGAEFVGEGGPHGPMGVGSDDTMLKFLEMDDFTMGMFTFSGELNGNRYGPGQSQAGVESPVPFGPNTSGSGFGPAGEVDGPGNASPSGSLSQSRRGRR